MVATPLQRTSRAVHRVRLMPVGIEMEVEEGETVLEAAFRQGIALMHGCREGQCASCKAVLVEGDAEMKKYSTFALPEMERDSGHVLLCRTLAYGDLEVELLNYDEEVLARAIPVRDHAARVTAIVPLTHDIRRLDLALEEELRFWAGQYVDITLPGRGVTRSFSMANPPRAGRHLGFIIKVYPGGAFSGALDGGLAVGDPVTLRGPFGTCFRREGRQGPMLLVGGGSGMSPLWSILEDQAASGEARPVRFLYGARRRRDLFYLDRIAALGATIADFRFVPVLSAPEPEDGWEGETGLVHEALRRALAGGALGDPSAMDAYACGPPPMIDAALPVLQLAGVAPERIHFDKFTPALR